jgi:hypothetical protein
MRHLPFLCLAALMLCMCGCRVGSHEDGQAEGPDEEQVEGPEEGQAARPLSLSLEPFEKTFTDRCANTVKFS